MKTKLQSSLFLLSALFLFGCAADESPEKAADKFLTAFNERQFDEARKYSTPETGKLIDLMENLTKMAQTEEKPDGGKIVIVDHSINGDQATVSFTEGDSEEVQELNMKKVDGTWLVHVTKEDIAAKDDGLGDGDDQDGFWMENEVDSLEDLSEQPATE